MNKSKSYDANEQSSMSSAQRYSLMIRSWILMVFLSFIFNFVWESWHAVFLYEKHNLFANEYILMMGYVSLLDALVVLGIYMSISFFLKDFLWIRELNKRKVTIFVVLGLITATIIEYVFVSKLKIWAYNVHMPKVFGIGLSPLIQLSATGILSVLLVKRILFK